MWTKLRRRVASRGAISVCPQNGRGSPNPAEMREKRRASAKRFLISPAALFTRLVVAFGCRICIQLAENRGKTMRPMFNVSFGVGHDCARLEISMDARDCVVNGAGNVTKAATRGHNPPGLAGLGLPAVHSSREAARGRLVCSPGDDARVNRRLVLQPFHFCRAAPIARQLHRAAASLYSRSVVCRLLFELDCYHAKCSLAHGCFCNESPTRLRDRSHPKRTSSL